MRRTPSPTPWEHAAPLGDATTRAARQSRQSDARVSVLGVHLSKPLTVARLARVIHLFEYSTDELVDDADHVALKVSPIADDADETPENDGVQRDELGETRTLEFNRDVVTTGKRRAVHLRQRRRRHGRFVESFKEIEGDAELSPSARPRTSDGGNASCNLDNSSTYSTGNTSARVDITCPNFMYAGPSLVSVSVRRGARRRRRHASRTPRGDAPNSYATTTARASTRSGRRMNHASNASTSYRRFPRHGASTVAPRARGAALVDAARPERALASPTSASTRSSSARVAHSRENEDIVVSVDARASSRSRVVVVVDAHLESKGASTPRAARPRGRDDATARASRVDDGDEGDDAVYGEARGRRARALGDIGSHRARAVDWRRDERARETTTRERARTRERATEGRRMMRATARAMVTPRTRGVRAMTTMGASGRERIVGARRRANRARAVGEDGKWTPGPFLRPDGSPRSSRTTDRRCGG